MRNQARQRPCLFFLHRVSAPVFPTEWQCTCSRGVSGDLRMRLKSQLSLQSLSTFVWLGLSFCFSLPYVSLSQQRYLLSPSALGFIKSTKKHTSRSGFFSVVITAGELKGSLICSQSKPRYIERHHNNQVHS